MAWLGSSLRSPRVFSERGQPGISSLVHRGDRPDRPQPAFTWKGSADDNSLMRPVGGGSLVRSGRRHWALHARKSQSLEIRPNVHFAHKGTIPRTLREVSLVSFATKTVSLASALGRDKIAKLDRVGLDVGGH